MQCNKLSQPRSQANGGMKFITIDKSDMHVSDFGLLWDQYRAQQAVSSMRFFGGNFGAGNSKIFWDWSWWTSMFEQWLMGVCSATFICKDLKKQLQAITKKGLLCRDEGSWGGAANSPKTQALLLGMLCMWTPWSLPSLPSRGLC